MVNKSDNNLKDAATKFKVAVKRFCHENGLAVSQTAFLKRLLPNENYTRSFISNVFSGKKSLPDKWMAEFARQKHFSYLFDAAQNLKSARVEELNLQYTSKFSQFLSLLATKLEESVDANAYCNSFADYEFKRPVLAITAAIIDQSFRLKNLDDEDLMVIKSCQESLEALSSKDFILSIAKGIRSASASRNAKLFNELRQDAGIMEAITEYLDAFVLFWAPENKRIELVFFDGTVYKISIKLT